MWSMVYFWYGSCVGEGLGVDVGAGVAAGTSVSTAVGSVNAVGTAGVAVSLHEASSTAIRVRARRRSLIFE